MSERRRAERFQLVDPGVGTLRLVQDVEVTHLGSHQAAVIALAPLPRGERVLLEIPIARQARPCTLLVRVVDSRVVMEDGSLRWRVRLKLDQSTSRRRRRSGSMQLPQKRAIMGALFRRIPVRVVEASSTGCVFESPVVVGEGAVGFVRMRTTTDERSDAVRIRRTSQTSHLIWQYRIAAEFLTLGPTSPESLRGLATIMTVASSPATS